MESSSLEERMAEVLRRDPRYEINAYQFVFEALDYTVRLLHPESSGEQGGDGAPAPPRHVTGQDLLEGIRRYALDTFGCLAGTVLESWGVRTTDDFGEIVFNLVDHGLMGKQESDRKEDFAGGYGGRPFYEVFQVRPVLDYCPERDEWKASYESVASG